MALGCIAFSPTGTCAERFSLQLCIHGGCRETKGSAGIALERLGGHSWVQLFPWCDRGDERRWAAQSPELQFQQQGFRAPPRG